jgi:hypothetical protein
LQKLIQENQDLADAIAKILEESSNELPFLGRTTA